MSKDSHRVIIVGGGISGLTAAAYLSKEGYDVLLLEKNERCGGLLNSFEREGFTFDAGARAILNAGIVRPMLRDLGIQLELLDSPVSIGIEEDVVHFDSENNLEEYKQLLESLYPEHVEEISRIISKIRGITKDMALLYGIDNPYFMDMKDPGYIFKTLIPWSLKFVFALRRMGKMEEPVESFLEKLTSNQSLIDIIAQHFFKMTPTFFALGYFYVYTDYIYPKGGTAEFQRALVQKIEELGGEIRIGVEIVEVNPSERTVSDKEGNTYTYDSLAWTADLKTLYRILDTNNLDGEVSNRIMEQKKLLLSRRGCDSVYSLFIGVDSPPDTFSSISHGHFFYTPMKQGLGEVHKSQLNSLIQNFDEYSKDQVLKWLDKYCELTTYEIAIPALRDPELAPEGKTGLAISMLFEYDLIKKIKDAGWHDEFQAEVESRMLKVITNSIYSGLKDRVLFQMSSTPLSIESRVGSSEGAIVGWSYESTVPVVHELRKMGSSVKTPIPNVYQAGQWVYSPAGLPTAILTGWHAAQSILKSEN